MHRYFGGLHGNRSGMLSGSHRIETSCADSLAKTRHSQLTPEEQADTGVYPGLIRLSVGIEHIDDIIADLEKGFAAAK